MRWARRHEARRLGNGLPRDAAATFRIAAKVVVVPGAMGAMGTSGMKRTGRDFAATGDRRYGRHLALGGVALRG
jgi:hypothetical protein